MFSEGQRKILISAIAVIVIFASFVTGFWAGSKLYPEINKVVGLSGKEPSQALPSDVDFSAFWKAWNVLNEKYITFKATTTNQQKVWGAISGLANSLGDPYTTFFPPVESKNFEASIQGEFGGVGMEV